MTRDILASIVLTSLFFTGSLSSFGQPYYSLSKCISMVSTHNPQISQAKAAAQIAEITRKNSANAYIPSLSISNQQNLSTGRVLDPTTYQFVSNRTVYDNSLSIGGSMTLFSAFERIRSIQKAELYLQSALLETERINNDLTLQVTALYLELLLDKETISIWESKIAMLQKQEALIARKVEYDAATPGDLFGAQADIANARVDLASAWNKLNLDKVSMCELLSIYNWQEFDISSDEEDYTEIEPRLWCEQDVVSAAFSLPQIKQGELAIDMARKDVAIALSSFWPTVKLNVGFGSTYSNARTKAGEEYSFRDQMRDNTSSYITLSLNIPILSAISVSNTVRQKKLAVYKAEHELVQTKLSLDKRIKQAIVNANASYEKYKILATDVDKCIEALRQTEDKYNAGAATYYDYQVAVGNLYLAKVQRLQSKYEYIFRTKIIDFFCGVPIK